MYYFSEMNNDTTISLCFKQCKYWTKKTPKLKLMNWKKIITKPTDNPCQPALETSSAALLVLYSNLLCHTVFSRKPHHLPSQWVTGVSHNHRATFQAKFIFQGSSHCSESGRAASPGMPRNVAVSQELSPAPACRELGRVGPGLLPSNTTGLYAVSASILLIVCFILCKAVAKWHLNVLKMFSTQALKKKVISLLTMDTIASLSCCFKPKTVARCSFFCLPVFYTLWGKNRLNDWLSSQTVHFKLKIQ